MNQVQLILGSLKNPMEIDFFILLNIFNARLYGYADFQNVSQQVLPIPKPVYNKILFS